MFLFLFIYLFLLQWTGGRELGRDQMGSVGFMGHATAGGRGYCLDHTVTTHNQSLPAKTKFKLPLYGTLMFPNVACRVLQFPLVVAMNLVINRKPCVTGWGGCGCTQAQLDFNVVCLGLDTWSGCLTWYLKWVWRWDTCVSDLMLAAPTPSYLSPFLARRLLRWGYTGLDLRLTSELWKSPPSETLE